MVTDNQGFTGKRHKHNHVIIKRKELISTNSLISEQKTTPSGLLCGPYSRAHFHGLSFEACSANIAVRATDLIGIYESDSERKGE